MRDSSVLPRIAITLGDPNGIGPELLIEVLQDGSLLEQMRPILYGPARVIAHFLDLLKVEHFEYRVIQKEVEAKEAGIYLIDVELPGFWPRPGVFTKEGARIAFLSLERACEGLQSRSTDALVTCPLPKESFASTAYTGHTEYLCDRLGAKDSLMLLCSELMRLALLTTHVPLIEVPKLLQESLLMRKCELLYKVLSEDFRIPEPRVALLSLNPHAGEGGLLGQEEEQLLKPFVKRRRASGWRLSGPFAADGFFGSRGYEQFDAVLALYHDQGLIPFKALCFETAVNYTAGLPVVRTSPAHGTAYELVGRKQATATPLGRAILTAIQLLSNRRDFEVEEKGVEA